MYRGSYLIIFFAEIRAQAYLNNIIVGSKMGFEYNDENINCTEMELKAKMC